VEAVRRVRALVNRCSRVVFAARKRRDSTRDLPRNLAFAPRSSLRLSRVLDMLPVLERNPAEHATCLGKSRNDFVFVIHEDPRESERSYADLPEQTAGIPGFHPATMMYINNKDLSRVETRLL